jgi:hypothetical protein
MAPIQDPMFPMGVGIVGLTNFLNLSFTIPSWIFSALEYGIGFPLCLYWYWRVGKNRPEAVMLLVLIPLFLAWRSLPSYFYCAAYPMLILISSRGYNRKGSHLEQIPLLNSPAEVLDVESFRANKQEELVA